MSELDLQASLRGMDQPLSAEASGRFQDQAFAVDLWLDAPNALTSNAPANTRLNLTSDLGDLHYDGSLQLGEAPRVGGAFEAALPNAAALAQQFDLDLPAQAALGRIEVSGKAAGALDTLSLTELDMSHTSDLLQASYKGSVSLTDDGAVNGDLSVASSRMRDLLHTCLLYTSDAADE